MTICTRIIEFDAAHRVIGHQNKCKYLHGHRYKIEASFFAEKLDTLGVVIDFGIIKEKLGKWVNDNWDHTTILASQDSKLGNYISEVTQQKIYYLKNNPTAENMANYLLKDICPEIFKEEKIKCFKIRIYETPNCYAEAEIKF